MSKHIVSIVWSVGISMIIIQVLLELIVRKRIKFNWRERLLLKNI